MNGTIEQAARLYGHDKSKTFVFDDTGYAYKQGDDPTHYYLPVLSPRHRGPAWAEGEVILGKKRKKKGQSEQTKKPVQPIPLTPDMVEGLKEQFRRFKEKFGRPPSPDDPIFFDPAADEPRPMIDEVIDQHMLEGMHKATTHPAIIHAYQTTGRLVTKKNWKNLTKAQLKEWTDAIDEWHRTHAE